MPLQLFVKLKY